MKLKIRHIFFIAYGSAALIIALKLFNIIKADWLILASPILFCVVLFIIYIVGVLIASAVYKRKQAKLLSEEELNTETSFFCHGCARPFDKPIKHNKGEHIFHKHCTPKNF